MFLLDDHFTRDNLLVGNHAAYCIDRRSGNTGVHQQLDPIVGRFGDIDFGDDLVQRLRVDGACVARAESRIGCQVLQVHDFDETVPQRRVAREHREVSTVGTTEESGRRVAVVAPRLRNPITFDMVMLRDRAHHQRDAGLEERCIDFLSLACFEPSHVCRQNTVARPHRGHHVAQRVTQRHRRPVANDGGRRKPAFRQRNHVDAGIIRLGAGVAVA